MQFCPSPPQDELDANRAKIDEMQDEHSHLLRQQEVLQAELHLALNNYQPKATIVTGERQLDAMLASVMPNHPLSLS